MALLFSDGVDTHDGVRANVAKKWTIVSTIAAVGTAQGGVNAVNGGGMLQITSAGGDIVGFQKNFAPQTQARFSLWHRFATNGTNTSNTRVCSISNATPLDDVIGSWGGSSITIGMNASLLPTIRINNTVVATGTTVMTSNVWRHYEIYVDYKASGGTIEVRINGDTEMTYTGATYSGTGAAAMSWFLLTVSNGWSDQSYDDVMIYTTTGDAPNSWLGPTTITTLYPLLDAAPNQGVATPALDGLTSPGAHGWWRLTALSSQGGSIMDVGELGWHTELNGPNVAVGGTASSTNGTPANAFDGSTATVWRTTTFPSSLVYHFTSAILPVKVSIRLGDSTNSSLSWSPKSFRIEYSDNGTTWTTWRTIYTEDWQNSLDYRQWFIGDDTKPSRLSDGVLGTKLAQSSGTVPYSPEQSYVTLNTINDTEMFEYSDLTDPTLDIKVVVANSLVKSTGYSNRKVVHRLRSDYNIQESTNLNAGPGTSSANVQSAHAVDPDTGGAWTLAGVNAAEFGVRLSL